MPHSSAKPSKKISNASKSQHRLAEARYLDSEEKYDSTLKLAKAYDVALDTRKFEVDLYWKRAAYFWAITAVVLGAIGLVISSSMKDQRLFSFSTALLLEVLSCIGFIVARAWSAVNRGGKFWQENWELQVELLEDAVLLPLYKSVLAKHTDKKGLTILFSASRVNEYLSLFFSQIFGATAILSFGIVIIKLIDPGLGLVLGNAVWIALAIGTVVLVYTVCFWRHMFLNARTVIASDPALNVTVRRPVIARTKGLPSTQLLKIRRDRAPRSLLQTSRNVIRQKILIMRRDRLRSRRLRGVAGNVSGTPPAGDG